MSASAKYKHNNKAMDGIVGISSSRVNSGWRGEVLRDADGHSELCGRLAQRSVSGESCDLAISRGAERDDEDSPSGLTSGGEKPSDEMGNFVAIDMRTLFNVPLRPVGYTKWVATPEI